MRSRAGLVAGAVTAVVAVALLARVDPGPVGELPVHEAPADAPLTPSTDGSRGDERAEEWAPVGTWRPMAPSPDGPRTDHTAVWTGLCAQDAPPGGCGELLVWGGRDGRGPRADGAAYEPRTDRWRTVPRAPREPLWRGSLPGVWTGASQGERNAMISGELIVWGATPADVQRRGGAADQPRGVAYDPVADTWRALPDAPIEPRVGHTLSWTGAEVVVWGGRALARAATGEPLTDGAAYSPADDVWRPLPDAPLSGRHDHLAAWLPEAGRLVVWGGVSRHGVTPTPVVDGAAYDPAADSWEPLPLLPVTTPGRSGTWRPAATRLIDPERLVVVAPLRDAAASEPVLAAYDPAARDWELWPAGPVGARGGARVAGASRVVVWGGTAGEDAAPGGVYVPRTQVWRTAPDGRLPAHGESATWTGTTLLTWGGGREGAVWDPG